MVLEVAILDIRPGQTQAFELAFEQAQLIISSMKGYQSHQLQRCIENPCRYILLVNWETLEAHTTGFRGSREYQVWRTLLHHFYDPLPVVEHYEFVSGMQNPDDLPEADATQSGAQLTEALVRCPYCGEAISVMLDPHDAGDQYIEDCQVCCRPITFTVTMDMKGHLAATVQDENQTF